MTRYGSVPNLLKVLYAFRTEKSKDCIIGCLVLDKSKINLIPTCFKDIKVVAISMQEMQARTKSVDDHLIESTFVELIKKY